MRQVGMAETRKWYAVELMEARGMAEVNEDAKWGGPTVSARLLMINLRCNATRWQSVRFSSLRWAFGLPMISHAIFHGNVS